MVKFIDIRVVSLSKKSKVKWCSKVCFRAIMLLFGMVIFVGLSCSCRRVHKDRNKNIETKKQRCLAREREIGSPKKGTYYMHPHSTDTTKKAVGIPLLNNFTLAPPVGVKSGGNTIKAADPVRQPVVHNNGPGQVAAINIVQEVDNPQLEAVDISNRLLRVLEDSANFTENEKAIIKDYIMDYDPYGELMEITIEGFEATGIVGDENVLSVGILPQARELVANRNRQRAEQERIKRRLALEMDRVEKENPDLKPNADDTCPICLCEDDLRPIRCRHFFHIDCIAKQLTITEVNPSCATCRTNLYDLVRPIA